MYSTSKALDIGYSTVRLVVDEAGTRSIPVGVVGWDRDRAWYGIRLLRKDERVRGVDQSRRKFIDVAEKHLRRWAETGEVPYAQEPHKPWESGFWDRVSKILTTGVRLDLPRAMDVDSATEEEIDALFDAVVQPNVPSPQKVARIDGLLSDALGPLADHTKYKPRVRAFQGVREPVLRGFRGGRGIVVIEGVNLAGKNARRDADALASKLMRIQAGPNAERFRFIVGYRASPGGLNGEQHMAHWIQERATPHVFDILREAERLRTTVRQAMGEVDPQGFLDLAEDSNLHSDSDS